MILHIEHVVREFCQNACRPFEDVERILCNRVNEKTEITVHFKEGREAKLHSQRSFKS